MNGYSRQYRDNGNMTKTYSWDTERTYSACIRDLIDTPSFKGATSFLDRKIVQRDNNTKRNEYIYADRPATKSAEPTTEDNSDYSEGYGARIDTETTIFVLGGATTNDLCVKSHYYGGR